MRLTLRTMLAFLDDILEPSDAQEISEKIEESKFASDLVHRIRNSTRRLRLGAPKIEGRGMGLDPNTVAEYLDNTLPTENVPDFEKVCLESDVHLAEVASCHQILTLVLGEPAEISETMRDRMYRIGRPGETTYVDAPGPLDHPEEPPSNAPGLDSLEEAVASPPQAPSADGSAKLPDYMRTGSRIPVKSLAITLVCGFLLAIVALQAVGPFGPDHPVGKFFSGGDETEVVAETERAKDVEPVTPSADPDEPPDSVGSGATPLAKPTAPVTPPRPSADATPAEADEKPDVPAPDTPPAEPVTTDAGVFDHVPDTAMVPPDAEKEDTGVPREISDTEPTSVGRYLSEEQVLGRWEGDKDGWLRLAPEARLFAEDHVLSLPTYRPQLLLAPSVKLTLPGPTIAQLQAGYEPETPQLAVEYGRVTLVSMMDRPARVRLNLSRRSGTAVLADAESVLAIEVRQHLPPGSNPMEVTPGVVILGTISGQVEWESEGKTETIGPGQVLVMVEGSPGQLMDGGPPPDWIDGRDLSDIDRRASQELRRHLDMERPLSLSLMEKTEFRQAEVRALVCRCLTWLDFYEPVLEALDDESQHSYWHAHFDALHHAVARSRPSAAKLLEALHDRLGDDAEGVFRLVWGYSPRQLEEGGDEELVDFLEHRAMTARVLAFENLRRITGKTLLFRPEQQPGQEKTKVIKWRKSLEEGEIRYKIPPDSGAAPPESGPEPPPPLGSSR